MHFISEFTMGLSLVRVCALAATVYAVFASPAPGRRASGTCTLSASGSDDAPAFLNSASDSSCSTITIPSGTTLSIRSKMNMTGLTDKHIVRLSESPLRYYVCIRLTNMSGPPRHHQIQPRPRLLDRQRLYLRLPRSDCLLAPGRQEHHPRWRRDPRRLWTGVVRRVVSRHDCISASCTP